VQKIDVDDLDEKLVSEVVPTNGILETEINDEIKRSDLLNIIDREVTTVNSIIESSVRATAQTDITTVPSDRMEQTSDRPEDAIATTTARIETHEFNPDLVTIVPTERIIDIANETSTPPRRRKVLLRRRPVSSTVDSTAVNGDQVKEEERPQAKPRKRKVIRRKRPLQDSWSSTVAQDSLEKEAQETSKPPPKSTTFEVGNGNDIEESTVNQIGGFTSVNKDDSESIATTNDHEVTDKVEDFTLAFTETVLSDLEFNANLVTPETPISGSTMFPDEEATDSFGAVTTATINEANTNEEYRSTEEVGLEATATASTLSTAAIDYTESYTFPEETSMPSTDLTEDASAGAARTSTISTLDGDSATSPMQTIVTSFTTEQYVPAEYKRKNLTRDKSPAANTTSRYPLVSLPTIDREKNSSEILSRRRNNFLIRRYPVSNSDVTTVGSVGNDSGYREEEKEEDAREETENARSRDLAIRQDVTEDTTVRNKMVLTNGLSDDTAEFWRHYTTVSSTARIKYPLNRAEETVDRRRSKTGIARDDVSESIPTDRSEIRPRYRIPVIVKRPFDPEEALSPRRYSGISSLDSALEESEETTEAARSARIGQSALRQPRTRYKLRGRDIEIKINKDAAASNRAEPAANTWQYSRTRSYSRRPSLTPSTTEAAITETLIPARKFDYVADAFHRKQQSLRTTTTTIPGANDLSDSQNLIDSDYTSTTTAKPLVTRLVTSIMESGTTERQKILIKTKYSSLTSTIRIPADQFSSTSSPLFLVAENENKDDGDNDYDEFINDIRQGVVERSTLPIEGAFSQRHGNRLTTESQESSTIEIESVFNNLIAGKRSAKQ